MTSDLDDPTQAQWRRLCEAAMAYRAQQPWRDFSDLDVFGVRDRLTEEIGWCCVLGTQGEVFGLAVYRGTLGLALHNAIASGEVEGADTQWVHDGWLVVFGDRGDLDAIDLARLRPLKLPIRGRGAWPQFRSLRPRYLPWHLTSAEAVRVADILEQATDVTHRFANRTDDLAPGPGMRYLVRVPRVTDGALQWEDARVVPAPPEGGVPLRPREGGVAPPLDEVAIARARARCAQSDATWECDYFVAPIPVGNPGQRPFYAPVLMLVDAGSGFIFDAAIGERPANAADLCAQFLASLVRAGTMPARIHVSDATVRDQLEATTRALGVRLAVVKRLPALEAARRSLESHFAR